jgi:DNA-binding transcriptional ArsR family regulator
VTGQLDDQGIDDALRALSHTSRRAMIRLTVGRDVPATELAGVLDMAPATASEHLKVLRKTGLVILTADGTWRRYRADLDRVEAVLGAVRRDLFRSPPSMPSTTPPSPEETP